MLNRTHKKNKKINCIFLFNWIILSVILITSCTNMKSVRSGFHSDFTKNNNEDLAKQPTQIENKDNGIDKIKDFEKKLLSKKIETNTIKTEEPTIKKVDFSKENRIPTLREQMQNIASNNDSILDKINDINTKLTNMEENVSKIKDYLDDTKLPESKNSIKGNYPANNDIPESIKRETYIESDEEINFTSDDNPINDTKNVKAKSKKKILIANSKVSKKIKNSAVKVTTPVKSQDNNIIIKPANIPDTKDVAKDNLMQKAEESMKSQDYTSAITYLKKVVNTPNSLDKAKANAMMGEANLKLGKINEAKVAYESIIKNHPNSEMVAKAKKMLQQL